jgi:DNA-directed RNA polymerase specialized sigma24 family protein
MSVRPLSGKGRDLTAEAFAQFLEWFNSNPDKAGEKYEDIRRRLIRIFVCRACSCPEDLADETINRVIRKFPEIKETYAGDPALYFYGVAHKVHLEFLRRKPDTAPPPIPDPPSRSEEEYACLEECIGHLPERSRELVLQYYQEERHAKIDLRKKLALQLGIPLNALRIRAHRIRANLEACVLKCLQRKAGEMISGSMHI